MIIFNTKEKADAATFKFENGMIMPIPCGDIWYLQEELLPVILEHSTLTEDDLIIRPLTEEELAILQGDI